MRVFFVKRWFLLLIVIGGVGVWLRPEWLSWTSMIDPRVVVAAVTFVASLSLESRRLWQSLIRPLPAFWAVCVSYSLPPLVARLFEPLLPGTDFVIGLYIMSAVPCTTASAVVWTRLAGGNEVVAVLATFLSTCLGWLVTTAWISYTIGETVAVDSLAMMASLFSVLVAPFALGQGLRVIRPLAQAASQHKIALSVLARLFIFLIMLKSAMDVRGRLSQHALSAGPFLLTAALCLGNHLLTLAVGFVSGKALRFSRPDRLAIAFACSQKTLPVALYLFDVYFQRYPLAVVPIVFYHVGQLVVDTFIAEEFAARHRRAEAVETAI